MHRLFFVLPALLLAFAGPADAQTAVPAPPPQTPMPTDAASPAPEPTPSSAPTPTPVPSPSPTANPYGYIINPSPGPSGAPQVTEIAITDRTLHSGRGFQMRVSTTADVATCSVEAYGATVPLQQAGVGLFTLAGQIPQVPFFYLGRNYTLTLVINAADGRNNRIPFGMRLEK